MYQLLLIVSDKGEFEMKEKKMIQIDLETWYLLRDIMKRHHDIYNENDAILFLLRLQGYTVSDRIPYPDKVFLPNKERWVEA
jgi:hypothetical protein